MQTSIKLLLLESLKGYILAPDMQTGTSNDRNEGRKVEVDNILLEKPHLKC